MFNISPDLIWTIIAWLLCAAFSIGAMKASNKHNEEKNCKEFIIIENKYRKFDDYIADLYRKDGQIENKIIEIETKMNERFISISEKLNEMHGDLKEHLKKEA